MGIDYDKKRIPYSYYDDGVFVDTTMREWSISKWVETPEDQRGPSIRPCRDNVIWAWDPVEDKSSGGIILTDPEIHGRVEMSAVGVVVAVGAGKWVDYHDDDGKPCSRFQEPELRAGDRIIGPRMVGFGLRTETDRLRLGPEQAISGVIED